MASKLKELEELQKKFHRVGVAAMRANEYEISSQVQDILKKLEQKIQGHRSNRKRK